MEPSSSGSKEVSGAKEALLPAFQESHADDAHVTDPERLSSNDSEEENELYKEEESRDREPWWKSNFFIRGRVLFGTWDGVFTTCMLNIFGIIVFLRTGWMVGNAGVGFSILIIMITLSVAAIGGLSAIGIVERCDVASGGVYFLLRHVLGGQIAAALGVLYCFGQAVSCSLYMMGFGESISVLIGHSHNPWIARAFGASALLILMLVNLAGVKFVIRLQLILLASIMVSALDFFVGSFIQYNPAVGVLRYSTVLLHNNTLPQYDNGESFFTVFGVFFPTACGVLAGINMSGDLREPKKAIAQGTIAATTLSGTFYLLFVLVLGSVCERTYLKTDYMIAEKVSAVGALWLIGLYVSSITSCMGSLYGAPRILQSIVSDNVFPRPIAWLAIGKGANKVPIVSLILIICISLLFIVIGDVNFLAPIVTMPFLLTYIAVDYSYFSLAVTYDVKIESKKFRSTSQQLYGAMSSTPVNTVDELNPVNTVDELNKSRDQYNSNDELISNDLNKPLDGNDDLDTLFPERKIAQQIESGKPAPDWSPETSGDDEEKTIGEMKPSWYSRLCNKWSSLIGAVGTIIIMFATQWLYSLIVILAFCLLYVYFTYAIPGSHPGVANFTLRSWFKTLRKSHMNERSQVVINQYRPTMCTTLAQLNDPNDDFIQRKPYHQSQMQPGEDLPMYQDGPVVSDEENE